VAYGDAIEHDPPIQWEEFEYVEYLYRLQDLLEERHRAFSIAYDDPEDPRAASGAAVAEWRRLDRDIEETTLELEAYAARRQLEAP
jgi:hypothetical protein